MKKTQCVLNDEIRKIRNTKTIVFNWNLKTITNSVLLLIKYDYYYFNNNDYYQNNNNHI